MATKAHRFATRLTHEQWLAIGLALVVVCILALVALLVRSYGWDLHATASLLFVLSYPLVWLAWRCHRFWRQALMQLTLHAQLGREGNLNPYFNSEHEDNLLLGLRREITRLAHVATDLAQKHRTVDYMLGQILDAWSVPVCLFDQDLKLTYRNAAMIKQLEQPMLLGSAAAKMGFELQAGNFSHPDFDTKWQCQTIRYLQHGASQVQHNWLFSALDISQLLNEHQSATQRNLIRVLGHEIRNSLTPMFSMTDTLLDTAVLDEQQTRLVLARIHKRSGHLLSFIGKYSALSQLPVPEARWFNFEDVLNEALDMMDDGSCEVVFQGDPQCFGDAEQIAQVLINLLKNAREASDKGMARISVTCHVSGDKQVIELLDNGPGFANLDNVLTPFYTTKKQGSGIGLSLCAEIIRNHGGQLHVANLHGAGAQIRMSWPRQQV
jgi:two-component system nitrogen regulation sensor histidine kinase NtrY